MSQIRDEFFSILSPLIEKNGYKYSKSQNSFTRKINDLSFRFSFKFDARGGLTIIDWIDCSISVFELENIYKKTFNNPYHFPCLKKRIHHFNKINIHFMPVMYSREALNFANEMNLKKLSLLSFEEKYPKERIENCAKKVYELFLLVIVPFFDNYDSIDKIYEEYIIENPTETNLNPLEIGRWNSKELHFSNLMFLKLLCKRYKKEEPLILSQYSKHKQKYIQNEKVLELIEKIENYTFE